MTATDPVPTLAECGRAALQSEKAHFTLLLLPHVYSQWLDGTYFFRAHSSSFFSS